MGSPTKTEKTVMMFAPKDEAERLVRWSFPMGLAIALLAAFALAFAVLKYQQAWDATIYSRKKIVQLDRTLNIFERRDHGSEGTRLFGEINELRRRVGDNPKQITAVYRLGALANAFMDKQLQAESTDAIVGDFRKIADEISNEERNLQQAQLETMDMMAHLTLLLVVLGAVAGLWMFRSQRKALTLTRADLGRQASLLSSIIDVMGDGLIVRDEVGRLKLVNHAAETLIDDPESPLLEMDPSNTSNDVEVGFRNSATGEETTLSVTSRRLYDGNGLAAGTVRVLRDMTKRKQIEREWRAAREAATEQARLKSDFLATMSHEIRTPMNGVIGMSTLLIETKLDDEQAGYVRTIKNSADALVTLINGILDQSKIEAGKFSLDEDDFNLRSVLEGVKDMFLYASKSKDVQFRLEIAEGADLNLRGDAGRLRQILINLVGNAFKFTDRGFVGLRVSTVENPGGNKRLLFEVHDSGPGIPEEVRRKLFQKYSQGQVKGKGGTGLGLNISREFVELMHGEIGVDSTVGSGSRFWFTAEFLPASPAFTSVRLIPTAEKFVPLKAHVLVAEDQSVNQLVVSKYLERLGVSCKIVNNGRSAVSEMMSGQYALVLMDCQMPEMSGVDATREIRRLESEGDLRRPIIALTAEGVAGERERCLEAGMDDFIRKPIQLLELHGVLRKWLPEDHLVASIDETALARLESFESGGRPLIEVLVEEYLKTAPLQVMLIQTAWGEGRLEDVSMHAHALKSTSQTLGLRAIGDTCEHLEDVTAQTEADAARVSALSELYESSSRMLLQRLNRKSGQAA